MNIAQQQAVANRRIDELEAVMSMRPFSFEQHATMLSDRVRLQRFRAAIDEVVADGDTVVDIGTGTGVLAAYAATRTRAPVVGIEAEGGSIAIARALAESHGRPNLEFLDGLSLLKTLDLRPDVVICELLGPTGVEEAIVEVCRDFVRRHESVKAIIPASLTVAATPVVSDELNRRYGEIVDGIFDASIDSWRYARVRSLIERSLSMRVVPSAATDVQAVGPPVPLATFRLGHDATGQFAASVEFGDGDFDFVRIDWTAQLSASVALSTALGQPSTHWEPHFVKRLDGARSLSIEYLRHDGRYAIEWSKGG